MLWFDEQRICTIGKCRPTTKMPPTFSDWSFSRPCWASLWVGWDPKESRYSTFSSRWAKLSWWSPDGSFGITSFLIQSKTENVIENICSLFQVVAGGCPLLGRFQNVGNGKLGSDAGTIGHVFLDGDGWTIHTRIRRSPTHLFRCHEKTAVPLRWQSIRSPGYRIRYFF